VVASCVRSETRLNKESTKIRGNFASVFVPEDMAEHRPADIGGWVAEVGRWYGAAGAPTIRPVRLGGIK
jgi:hypothetical protein